MTVQEMLSDFTQTYDADTLSVRLNTVLSTATPREAKDVFTSLSNFLSGIDVTEVTKIIAILSAVVTLAAKLRDIFVNRPKDLDRALDMDSVISITNGLLQLIVDLVAKLNKAGLPQTTEELVARIQSAMDTYFPEWQKTW